jgi:ubiquinone/menaquinone biosynthesis C-methylase UbiE
MSRSSSAHNQPKAHSEAHLVDARDYWWNDDYLGLMAERLDLIQCQSMADIGCGKGMMALKLAGFLSPGAQVFGLDRERRYIKAAKQKVRHRNPAPDVHFHFEEGDAHHLPYESDSLDVTLCQTLLIHIEDPAAVIREMIRVTRPGGWVVAMEPNNLAPNLMFDRYIETDYDVDEVLQVIGVRLRIEKGKKRLGEGFNSLGDVLPDLYSRAGLENIQVWLSDKAMPIIPPYDSHEMRVRVAQMITWIESGEAGFGYDENLRYYLAGGGKKSDFESYWQRVSLYKLSMLKKLKQQEFISAGGSVMYVVAGRVAEAEAE